MSVIVNDRDVLLQAAPVRFVMPTIGQGQVDGLPGRLDGIESNISGLEGSVSHLMNTSQSLAIRATSLTFIGSSGTTSPSSITLTAVRGAGLTGTISWSVFTGSATISPSGDNCTVTGSSVTGQSVTIRAQLTTGGVNHFAFVTLSRLGAISAQDSVSLTNQVTGQLAAGNVSGLGALAMLNTVNLNSQVTGALNGQTQVTNLGNLAYANAIAANQIGAGTLAAGVVYAGSINADNITSGMVTGRTLRTAASGARVEVSSADSSIGFYNSAGSLTASMYPSGSSVQSMRIQMPTDGGSVFLEGPATRPALILSHPLGGSGNVPQLEFGSGVRPAFRIAAHNNAPSTAPAGSVCFYAGWLCFSNGTHWFRSDGVQIT